ncbi:MAG TPA: hypothetical protein VFN95_05810, partial [Flavitalea sp.]|nr:hypothetical protein [Flavitalea sp.]
LLLIGVDVNAMYDDDVIRADSVYCENPLFNINIIVSDTGSKNKGMPDPEKIIRDLTGNLDLGFIGVKNAGIKISISGSKERSLFNSNKDNFIMRGLRVNADSSEPVVVQKFDMLVRDYRLYNEDSTAVYGFDSVAFSNNKIALNNFTVSTTSGRNVQRSERRYRIPYLELTGLDWYSLVFDETFKAKEAVLYSPVINYTKNANSPRKKRINLFTSLQTIDDLVTLDKINIVNGQINMKLDPSSSLNFHDVNLSLYSDKLLKSTNRRGLRKAIDYLSLSSGFLIFKDITARINNIRYTGSNLIRADKLSITSKTKKVSAEVHDVLIDNMLFDDNLESMVVDGLRWKDATIELSSHPGMQKSDKRQMNIELKNISGENTNIKFSTDKTNISGLVQSLKIASLSRVGNQAVHALGFFASGSDLNVKTNPLHMTVGAYELSGNSPSFVLGLNVERIEHGDSLSIKSPRVNFSVDINQILAGDLHVSNVESKSPDIILKKWNTVNRPPSEPALQASISIDTIVVTEPDVYIASHRNDSVTIVSMPRSGKSNIKASAFALDKDTMKLDLLSFNTNILTVTRANGDAMGVNEGSMNLELTNLEYWKKGGKPFWTGIIKSLEVKNPTSMGIGKNNNKLSIKELTLGNFRLSSDHLDDFRKVLRSNVSAWLRTATGYYVDNKATIRWYNAGYDNINKTFSLDSFSYHPTPARDSAIAQASHQFDYITFHSGPIHFKDFDLQKYRSDTSIIANTIEIKNPVVSIYRDRQLPFLGGVIKPLPVGYIRNINIPISVKRVNIRGGDLTYTEVNPKTKAEGTVFFTNINGA